MFENLRHWGCVRTQQKSRSHAAYFESRSLNQVRCRTTIHQCRTAIVKVHILIVKAVPKMLWAQSTKPGMATLFKVAYRLGIKCFTGNNICIPSALHISQFIWLLLTARPLWKCFYGKKNLHLLFYFCSNRLWNCSYYRSELNFNVKICKRFKIDLSYGRLRVLLQLNYACFTFSCIGQLMKFSCGPEGQRGPIILPGP